MGLWLVLHCKQLCLGPFTCSPFYRNLDYFSPRRETAEQSLVRLWSTESLLILRSSLGWSVRCIRPNSLMAILIRLRVGPDIVVFSGPNVHVNVQNLGEADWELVQQFNISAWKGNLSAFKERGGKILTYHDP
ncbi:hypothetical protein K435DRAFT_440084 [Dendrothele bispora CBS 962.96]|uniref:Uncharacterized protein n=1 Tax=Dendrothele bispora (strain CBS 962.96) TaxID=1314807 RepID=A0A4V4HGZ0_DENBC|nr:hypothetical protein K435DRAFT_440084 [Dendrothele bispora CBS 962.96]